MAGTRDQRGEDQHRQDGRQHGPADPPPGVEGGQPVKRAEREPRAVGDVCHGQDAEMRQQDTKEKPEQQELDRAGVTHGVQLPVPAAADHQHPEQAVHGARQPHDRNLLVDGLVIVGDQKLRQHGNVTEKHDQPQVAERAEAGFQGRSESKQPVDVEQRVEQTAVQQRRGEGAPDLTGPNRREDAQPKVQVVIVPPRFVERADDFQRDGDPGDDQRDRGASEVDLGQRQHGTSQRTGAVTGVTQM